MSDQAAAPNPAPIPNQAPAPPLDSAPALSQIERVVDAFIAPSKTFTDIRRSASWWLPWLIAAIFGLAFIFTVQHQVGWMQVVQNALHQNPKAMARLQQLQPDRAAAAIAMQAKITSITVYILPVSLLLVALIGAAILWGTVNFGFGGHAKFSQMYAVWFYATLPLVITSILGIITLFAGLDPSTFNIRNPVGTNIGYYLSADSQRWLIKLLTSVDVLKIWTAILLTIGCAKVAQIKKSSAAIAVFGWWIIGILISTAFVAIFG